MNWDKAFSTFGFVLNAIKTLFSSMRYFRGLPFGLKSCKDLNQVLRLKLVKWKKYRLQIRRVSDSIPWKREYHIHHYFSFEVKRISKSNTYLTATKKILPLTRCRAPDWRAGGRGSSPRPDLGTNLHNTKETNFFFTFSSFSAVRTAIISESCFSFELRIKRICDGGMNVWITFERNIACYEK